MNVTNSTTEADSVLSPAWAGDLFGSIGLVQNMALLLWVFSGWPLRGHTLIPAALNLLWSVIYVPFSILRLFLPESSQAVFCTSGLLYWTYILTENMVFAQRCALLEPFQKTLQKIWRVLVTCDVVLMIVVQCGLLAQRHQYIFLPDVLLCAFIPSETVRVIIRVELAVGLLILVLGFRAVYRLFRMTKLPSRAQKTALLMLASVTSSKIAWLFGYLSAQPNNPSFLGVLRDSYMWFDLFVSLALAGMVFFSVYVRQKRNRARTVIKGRARPRRYTTSSPLAENQTKPRSNSSKIDSGSSDHDSKPSVSERTALVISSLDEG